MEHEIDQLFLAILRDEGIVAGYTVYIRDLDDGITVTSSDGNLILKQLQLQIPGEPKLEGKAFADHYGLQIGDSFTTPLEG